MVEDILLYLGRLYPEIWAAFINLIGLVIVGRFINKKIVEITSKNEERLARISPTFQLQIEETRQFIKLHYEMTKIFLVEFYERPLQYLNLLYLVEMDKSKKYETIIEERIIDQEDELVLKKFKKLKDENNLFYAIYLSLIPSSFTFDLDLEKTYLTKFYQNSPFISIENQRLSNELLLEMAGISQKLEEDLLNTFKDNAISLNEKYNIFISFWSNNKRNIVTTQPVETILGK